MMSPVPFAMSVPLVVIALGTSFLNAEVRSPSTGIEILDQCEAEWRDYREKLMQVSGKVRSRTVSQPKDGKSQILSETNVVYKQKPGFGLLSVQSGDTNTEEVWMVNPIYAGAISSTTGVSRHGSCACCHWLVRVKGRPSQRTASCRQRVVRV